MNLLGLYDACSLLNFVVHSNFDNFDSFKLFFFVVEWKYVHHQKIDNPFILWSKNITSLHEALELRTHFSLILVMICKALYLVPYLLSFLTGFLIFVEPQLPLITWILSCICTPLSKQFDLPQLDVGYNCESDCRSNFFIGH